MSLARKICQNILKNFLQWYVAHGLYSLLFCVISCLCVLFRYILQGHPFMESLLDNKALLYSLMASGGFVLCMITGSVPEINQQFEIVPFPPKVKLPS